MGLRHKICRGALALATVSTLAAHPAGVNAEGKTGAGNGTLYIGTFPNQIWIIDEATGEITGKIAYGAGIPRRTVMSADRTRFYTLEGRMETMEVLDIASRSAVDRFTLSEGRTQVRIRSFVPDPLDRFVMLLITPATKQIDRWEIGHTALVQYDLATHQIARTIAWPDGIERQRATLRFSVDGGLMYLFSNDDVLIYETDTFSVVDTWPIGQPLEGGMGALDFAATDDWNEEPGYYSGLFTTRDPVQHRQMLGIGRVNLAERRIDFKTIGPAPGRLGFTLSPDRTLAYGLLQEIGRYEFWRFDLVNGRVTHRWPFAGRPRMSLKISSNGKVLYIHNAGETIDLYDADTFERLQTIDLPGDATTDLFVVPPAP